MTISMSIELSICIPTYNRSKCLSECLQSIMSAVSGYERFVEILISDNASTDGTGDIIRAFQKTYPWIRYHRNAQNIGGERNFFLLATMAKGENIWIFGDDDKMNVSAVARILNNIRTGYGLTICNYSSWDKQFIVQRKEYCLSGNRDESFEDSNILMKRFGLHLGYISTIIIKKKLFLKLPANEYESFVEYGFPFLYSVYTGIANGACKIGFISEPLVHNRSDNSGNYDWYKYFVAGSALIFDKLLSKGYTHAAVRSAKKQVLRFFLIPHVFHIKSLKKCDNTKIDFRFFLKYYKKIWLFWIGFVPIFLMPPFLIRLTNNIRLITRRLIAQL